MYGVLGVHEIERENHNRLFAQEISTAHNTHQKRNKHNGWTHHFEINRTTEQYTLMKVTIVVKLWLDQQFAFKYEN